MSALVAVRVADTPETVVTGRQGDSDLAVINQIFGARVYDPTALRRWPDLQATLGDMRARGRRPLVIDAGANIGASALFFADFYADAHVIAVEPEPGNFQLLAHNASQRPGIACVHGALASRRGRFAVFDPQAGAVGFRAAELGGAALGASVPTGTVVDSFAVADLLAMAPADAEPFLIKIDIEGGEGDVFSRNIAWIDLFPVLLVELHDWMLPGAANSRNFLCAIAASGRDFVPVGENIYSIRN